jgi:DNA-binding transcriptional LysR family regulator
MASWDDLRVFLAVYRRASHAAAARMLRVDATTVGRRIGALEAALGSRLFARTPAGLTPTAAALALLPCAERMESEMLSAERAIAGSDERVEGDVCITAPDGTTTFILIPALASLRARHPALRPELVADSRALDLVRREADVAVRFFRPREDSLVVQRIGTITYALYAGESYLARRGRPRNQRELASHDWVGYGSALGRPQPAWLRRLAPREKFVARVNTTTALVAACAAGYGLTVLGTMIAEHDPRLIRVLPRLTISKDDIWAVTHPDLRRSARVVAVLRWLETVFAQKTAR